MLNSINLSKMKTKNLLLMAVAILMALPMSAVTNRYVGTGSQWTGKTPLYTDLATALTAATSADSIFVAAGTYTPVSGGFAMKDGVNVYGGFDGTESTPVSTVRKPFTNKTILDANFLGRVLTQGISAFTNRTIWDGFIIQNGRTLGSTYGNAAGYGGGVYLGSNATLKNCIIRNNTNTTGQGGGVYVYNTISPNAQIINCVIHNNTAKSSGAGLFIIAAGYLAIGNSTICNNKLLTSTGTPAYSWGGSTTNMKFVDLIIWGNTGGGGTGNLTQVAANPTTSAVQDAVTSSPTTLIGLSASNTGSTSGINYPNFKTPSTFSGAVYGGYALSPDSLTNLINSDWQLNSTSACFNSGTITTPTTTSADYSFPTVDLNLNPRTAWGKIDLGAFEYPRTAGVSTFYVKPMAGSQWTTQSYPYLQTDLATALSWTQAGDEVWVASGTYTSPSGGFIMKDGVNVLGGFDGTEVVSTSRKPLTNKTILDGNFVNKLLIQGTAGFTIRTKWDGFIMQNGKSTSSACISIGQNATLTNCVIRNNTSTSNGGAIQVDQLTGTAFDALTDATSNKAWIINSVIHNNTANAYGGGIFFKNNTNVVVANTAICNNSITSASGQGGISNGTASTSVFTNCILWGNMNNTAVTPTASQTPFGFATFNTSAVQGLSGVLVNLDAANSGSIVGVYYPQFTTPSTTIGSNASSLPTDISASDWSLLSSSACLDKGVNSSTVFTFPTTDLAGNARQIGTKADLGAVEYQTNISTSVTTLSGMIYDLKNNTGPSAEKTCTVSGSSLLGNVTVTAPTGFEVSLSTGTGFLDAQTITASGTLAATTVYVRLKANQSVGDYTGDLSLTSTGAATQIVALTGKVSDTTTGLYKTASSVRIMSTATGIYSTFDGAATIELYANNGMLMEKITAVGSYARNLKKGMYIISINGKASKFIK